MSNRLDGSNNRTVVEGLNYSISLVDVFRHAALHGILAGKSAGDRGGSSIKSQPSRERADNTKRSMIGGDGNCGSDDLVAKRLPCCQRGTLWTGDNGESRIGGKGQLQCPSLYSCSRRLWLW